jgi:quercetin dioxygenase-like cupin family protein
MKSIKWVVSLAVVAALAFAGGVFAAGKMEKKAGWATPSADVKWSPIDPKDTEMKGPKMTVLFGDPAKKGAPIGILLHFPAGAIPGPHTHSSDDYAVVVKGVQHNWEGDNEGPGLGPGSIWYQPGKQVHNNHCEAGSECEVFVYMPNGFDFQPAPAPKK